MRRKALIIKGKPYNDHQKQSFEDFANTYASYFGSISGGAFEAQEIEVLDQPSVTDIRELLKEQQLDYSILVLIGHGATQDSKQLFHLKDKEVINPGQIELSKKQLVIVESCRSSQSDAPIVDITDKVPRYRLGGVLRFLISREKAKEQFIAKVNSCSEGLVVCFACDEDESASKFHFSKTLLEKAKAWSNSSQNTNTTLPVTTLMPVVAREVTSLSQASQKNQTPQIQGDIDFPFAVSKY